MFLGETETFKERQRVREASASVGKTFVQEGKVALKKHWILLIYLVMLMAGFNFMSHGSQDLYPTMLKNQFNFSANAVTVTQVVANLGAMTGGTVVGYLSQVSGGKEACRDDLFPVLIRRFPEIRPPSLDYRHLHHRRRSPLPLHIHLKQSCHCRRLLRAILRARRLGCHSYPLDGAVSWLFQDIRCWNQLPTW
jgi:hypothetical protein